VISLANRINDALPQTQCTRCGYPDCKAYAQAIAQDNAPINQCPPGGLEGVAILSQITGRPELSLNPDNGIEGPMTVAVIDEAWCIGCTLCIKACPTDAILGSNKVMHTVIEAACTGCDLCLPVCPVDCIEMVPISNERTGWSAWSPELAQQARKRYEARQLRVLAEPIEEDTKKIGKQAIIEAALAKAKARQKS
jgi:electron transport complex protein RnfB